MNLLQKITCMAFICLIALNYGCNKDNDPVSCNYALELQTELEALVTAGTAYGNNPTTANCQAYITAYSNYLTAAETYVDCATVAGQGAELQAAIDEAQAELALIQC